MSVFPQCDVWHISGTGLFCTVEFSELVGVALDLKTKQTNKKNKQKTSKTQTLNVLTLMLA